MEALGGEYGLATQPDGVPGSTFWCSVPICPSQGAGPLNSGNASREPSRLRGAGEGAGAAGPHLDFEPVVTKRELRDEAREAALEASSAAPGHAIPRT